jgi:hypothetical protein
MMEESVVIRYDGPALAGHRMDVADLAPALFGLSELCKIANAKFNGDSAAIKVLIGADQEQKCFQFDMDVVQTLWQQTQTFLEHKPVKTAKEILEWLGLIGLPASGAIGLFQLIKKVNGRAISEEKLVSTNGRDFVQLTITGDGNSVTVNTFKETYDLLRDDAAIASVKKVVEPVSKPGYEKLEFEQGGKIFERVEKSDAARILAFRREHVEVAEENLGEPQTITAFVKVYAPVYDIKADRWRFMYNNGHPYIDISETDIAAKAIERGGALINDTYKVKLEIQQTESADGAISAKYKIKEVLEFLPANLPYQPDLLEVPPKPQRPKQLEDPEQH